MASCEQSSAGPPSIIQLPRLLWQRRSPVDRVNPETRSRIMASVHSKDTGPELVVRRILHRQGVRFRLHRKDLPGSPDIAFMSRRVALFVHGCFWHGHRHCDKGRLPKSRVEYWEAKVNKNKARDKKAEATLRELGWTMIVIWQCQTRDVLSLSRTLDRVLSASGS